ncbi:MAG: CRTAC1 family protein [Pirellulaceae bacterium]
MADRTRLGWNGITAGDLDEDGDIDYVVTNFGLNTKYHASAQHPALLYYGDFDQSGKMQLVEAEHEDDTLFPVRGKSCSTKAMPHLADKFHSYKEFALASLDEIYTPKCLDESHRFAANELRTGVFWNDRGTFRFQPLDRIAQIAPAFGVHVADVNLDGHSDIMLAHNFFVPQVETGRMDSGQGQVLLGNGQGDFQPVRPDASGFQVPGDARAFASADIDGDLLPEFLVATNDGPVIAFRMGELQQRTKQQIARLQLVGPPGNRQAVGANIIWNESGKALAQEISAGGGYLSQNAIAPMRATDTSSNLSVTVTWPDGTQSHHDVTKGQTATLNWSLE